MSGWIATRRIDAEIAAYYQEGAERERLATEGRLDWEDAMLAPVLWDAACLAATPLAMGRTADAYAALEGFGVDPAGAELGRLVRVRMLQNVLWSALVVAGNPNRRSRLEQRLAWLDAD